MVGILVKSYGEVFILATRSSTGQQGAALQIQIQMQVFVFVFEFLQHQGGSTSKIICTVNMYLCANFDTCSRNQKVHISSAKRLD